MKLRIIIEQYGWRGEPIGLINKRWRTYLEESGIQVIDKQNLIWVLETYDGDMHWDIQWPDHDAAVRRLYEVFWDTVFK